MTVALLIEPIDSSIVKKKNGDEETVERLKVKARKIWHDDGNISFDNNIYGIQEPHWLVFWKPAEKDIAPIRKLNVSDIRIETENQSLIILFDGKFLDIFGKGQKSKLTRLEQEIKQLKAERNKLKQENIRLAGEGRAAIKSEQKKMDKELVQNVAEMNKSKNV